MIKATEGKQTSVHHIHSSLWGAVLGDVIGAFLQFSSGINQQKVQLAFKVKGGGLHKLQPGQPTDDSQLAYAVGKGLLRGKGKLNLNFIAEQMGNWYLSKPIDVGGTIKQAVPKACGMKVHQAHLVRKGAKQRSQKSQSNGTLMAITPMSIWCHNLSYEDTIKAMREYTILIHPNQLVVLTNTFYTLVLCYLLNNSEDSDKRINAYKNTKNKMQEQIAKNKEGAQFQKWLQLIERAFEDYKILYEQLPANKAAGWVRIAFSYAMVYLGRGMSFQKSIHELLLQKGDTDTNACILGGVLGSCYTIEQLQLSKQVQIINKWRPMKVKRPEWMVPGLVIQKLTIGLQEISPQNLVIVGGFQEYQKQKYVQKQK